MEGMKHFGWGVIDCDGERVPEITLRTKGDADKYARTVNKHGYFGREGCISVELFYKEQP